jgi:thioredoxin 1
MITITPQNFKETIASNNNTIIDVTATWCGPCKIMVPIFEDTESSVPEVVFAKMDADTNRDSLIEFGIRQVPSFLIFKNGTLLDVKTGVMSKSELISFINENVTE